MKNKVYRKKETSGLTWRKTKQNCKNKKIASQCFIHICNDGETNETKESSHRKYTLFNFMLLSIIIILLHCYFSMLSLLLFFFFSFFSNFNFKLPGTCILICISVPTATQNALSLSPHTRAHTLCLVVVHV